MALIGSNKNIVKNDIDFFAAFTATARKQAQALAAVVIFAGIFVVITLGILGVAIGKWVKLTADVKALNEELAKPEYAALDIEAANLEAEVNRKTQYLYTLSSMRKTVDEVPVASIELCELLGVSIPNDAYITDYSFTGTTGSVTGFAYSYYSVLDMLNRLQASDVFVLPNIVTTRTVPATGNEDFVEGIQYVDSCYSFSISGNLTADVYATMTRYTTDGVTTNTLTGAETQTLKPGEAYQFDGITQYNNFVLVSIRINGAEVTTEEFDAFVAANSISGVASSNVTIDLYYSSPSDIATQEGSEG